MVGTLLARLMFGEPLIQAATHIRTGLGIWTGEIVATFLKASKKVGATRVIAKPFRAHELLAIVRDCLGEAGAAVVQLPSRNS